MDAGVYLPSKILPAFVVVVTRSFPRKEPCTESDFNTTDLSGIYRLKSVVYKANAHNSKQDNFLSLDELGNNQVVVLHVNRNEKSEAVVGRPVQTDDRDIPGVKGNIISSDGIMDGEIQQFDQHAFVFYRSDFYMPGDRLIFTMVKH